MMKIISGSGMKGKYTTNQNPFYFLITPLLSHLLAPTGKHPGTKVMCTQGL
jgi:hypothetical protein